MRKVIVIVIVVVVALVFVVVFLVFGVLGEKLRILKTDAGSSGGWWVAERKTGEKIERGVVPANFFKKKEESKQNTNANTNANTNTNINSKDGCTECGGRKGFFYCICICYLLFLFLLLL